MSSMAIRDKVRDDFIDLLLIDQADYDDRLDYFEVNFNGALARDRVDAKRHVQSEENRTQELGCEDEEISPEVERAIESYDPFEAYELDKESYRRRLDAAINALPPLQQRIVEMWRQEIPIISKDPNEMTISKALKSRTKPFVLTAIMHLQHCVNALKKRRRYDEKSDYFREDVLRDFSVEFDAGKETLLRYLTEFPEYAEELVDLSRELAREVGDDMLLTATDVLSVESAMERFRTGLTQQIVQVNIPPLRFSAAT